MAVSSDDLRELADEIVAKALELYAEEDAAISGIFGVDDPDLGGVRELFEWFAGRKPEVVDTMCAYLEEAIQAIEDSHAERVSDDVKGCFSSWNTPSATQFKDRFAYPFKNAAGSQAVLLLELMNGLEGQREIIVKSRESAYNIGRGILSRLDVALRGHEIPWSDLLTVTAAVSSLMLLPVPAIGSWATSALVLGLAGNSGTIAGSVERIVLADVETSVEIIDDLNSKMNWLKVLTNLEEAKLASMLNRTLESIDAVLKDKGDGELRDGESVNLLPERPVLIERSEREFLD